MTLQAGLLVESDIRGERERNLKVADHKLGGFYLHYVEDTAAHSFPRSCRVESLAMSFPVRTGWRGGIT